MLPLSFLLKRRILFDILPLLTFYFLIIILLCYYYFTVNRQIRKKIEKNIFFVDSQHPKDSVEYTRNTTQVELNTTCLHFNLISSIAHLLLTSALFENLSQLRDKPNSSYQPYVVGISPFSSATCVKRIEEFGPLPVVSD